MRWMKCLPLLLKEPTNQKRNAAENDTDSMDVDGEEYVNNRALIEDMTANLLQYQANAVEWLQSMYLKGCHSILNVPKGAGILEIVAGLINNLAFGPIQSWGHI